MEKLDSSLSKNYGPLVIWADDLADVFAELQQHGQRCEFVADNVRYDSVEEFIQECRGRKSSEVSLSCREPYVSIDLASWRASISTRSRKLLAAGLYHRIDAILSRCERKPRFLFRVREAFVGLLAFLVFDKITGHSITWLDFLGAVVWLWNLIAMFYVFFRSACIYPVYKRDRPNFIKRTAEPILVAVLAAVASAVATQAVNRFWPNDRHTAVETGAPPPKN